MKMKKFVLAIFSMACLFSVVNATEFRSPLIVERGPMRYVFEGWDAKDYSLKLWAAGYYRESHKAFLKHGTNTSHLSALFFNKSDFPLIEIFPNSAAPLNSENYSPFVAVGELHPRITYVEKGISLGGRVAFPVSGNRGRFGFRVQVPFRRIEIEREDLGDRDTNQLDDVLTGEIVNRYGNTVGTEASNAFARAVRMDFLQAIPYTASIAVPTTAGNVPLLNFSANGLPALPNGEPYIAGNKDHWDVGNIWDRISVVIHSPEGTLPHSPDRLLGIHQDPTAGTVADDLTVPPTALPADGNVSDAKQYKFVAANDYTPLNINTGTATAMAQARERSKQLWITSVHLKDATGGNQFNTGSKKLWPILDLALQNYNANMYEWMEDRDFELASETRSGIGDIDLDMFYEHQVGDDFAIEVMAGVRFPTGASDKYCTNPYRPHLGNGEHFEIKFGGMFAFQASDCIGVKVDGRFAFVLEATEKRSAAFKGAQIKNIGPCVDTDVSWEYFVGTFDFNLFHPKTNAISAVVGYEFYYKTQDSITFKQKTMESWLGKTTADEANLQELDHCIAERNTEAMSHKIRVETSFRINQYFELYFGGTYTFAGQNIPRECDGQCGFVVTF
jgi:hypothetical protein